MEDILLSQKQYLALKKRLDEINSDVASIKVQSNSEAGYFDNYDLIRLLHVSYRTIQRWRRKGCLPYTKVGPKYYYKAEDVFGLCRVGPEPWVNTAHLPAFNYDIENSDQSITCKRCPLFLLFDS